MKLYIAGYQINSVSEFYEMLNHVSDARFRSCAGFVGQKRRNKIPSKLHLLLYKMFNLFQHSRLTILALVFDIPFLWVLKLKASGKTVKYVYFSLC
jgi:hypothetical protein